jgi:predicted lipoprotein with Yx(FWY)xxD motif
MDRAGTLWHWVRRLGPLVPLALLVGIGTVGVGAQTAPTVQPRDLGGNTGTVLTDGQGKTLYTFSLDTDGTSHCADACATAWPPLELASGTPVAPSGLSGTLGVISRSDGKRQVTYNNQPLYYFSGDSAAGQANGNGRTAFNGTWRVAQPAGAATASTGATPPSGTASGQSGAQALPASGTGGLGNSPDRTTSLLLGLLALLLGGGGLILTRRARR